MFNSIKYLLKILFSDSMGNMGAFITMTGKDMTPQFTSYKAVVS